MADYLDAFAQESEEQITELNNALLEFEDDPSDEAAMEQIFRTAHTLKGNCGAMGFDPAEELAHALEDLLEAIRSNRVAVTPELMDAVFAGVDELDAMISEAVETGEVTRRADDEIETLREYAEAEGLAEPTDAAIDELLDSVSPPSNREHSVYHVRLDVAGDPAVHGRAVVDALDDAFELLGTDPDGDAIDAGDYDGTVDAAFASVVERAAVEAALDPVDAVDDQVITDVTDRVEDRSADDGHDPVSGGAVGTGDTAADDAGSMDDLSVDELLEDEDVDQFDDLDEMAEDVGDTSEFEDLGDAGSFADLGISDDDVEIEGIDDEPAADVEAADDATDEAADAAAAEDEEVDPVGFDELQDELDDLEFDEYDSDDEVGFDELLDEDELEDDGAFGESSITSAAADDAVSEIDDVLAADADAETEATADAEAADDAQDDATASDLFGGDDAETADAADGAAIDAADDIDVSVVDAADDVSDEEATVAGEDEPVATADDATVDDRPVVTESSGSDDESDAAEASTDDEFDAGEVLDSEPLDESAQSFGEGGMDLSEETDENPPEVTEDVPTDADDLDLDDSFGEMEAEAAEEAADETSDDEAAPLDLGEGDIDFGDGTVAGSDAPETEDESDEAVGVGGAVADDSFDPDATEAGFDEDAATADDGTNDAVEPVDGFGDDEGVLDLDSGAVAGSETPPEGDEDALEAVDAEDVGPGARIPDDADAGLDADADLGAEAPADAGDELDADAGFDATVQDASADEASQLDDPGFGDGPETADDGPDVDEERIERIRSLGVPQLDEDGGTGAASTQSIRVDVESLDRMLNMVEGLVTSRARLRRALIENEPREILEDELDDLEDVTSELQDTVMDVRLVPLRTAVNKLPRIVRDVAREEDKQVDFEMVGEDVELDRSILDEIGDPLVHLVRNAVDHGIETPEVREEAGKDPEGSVELRATRERDRVSIVVEDDGAGIDADAVRDAAVEEGIHTRSEVDSMGDEDVHELIFHSGFSTAAEVTDVSGRGVGMDVVAETVERLDGSVSIESEPGEGTTIAMELPVTLAIAEVLFVDVGGEEYGIPIKTVDEIGPVVGVETQDGQEVLVSDGGEDRRELIRLDEALSTPGRSDPNSGMLVHLRDDVREAAIHCDQVREQQEVVVKPFEGVLGDVPGLSGASVLGDGDVVTILDVETL